MDKDLKEALKEILDKCYEISVNTEHDVFFDYSPHVNSFSVHIHEGGWEKSKESINITYIAGDEITYENIVKAMLKLKKYE